jgi:hypothetical protein
VVIAPPLLVLLTVAGVLLAAAIVADLHDLRQRARQNTVSTRVRESTLPTVERPTRSVLIQTNHRPLPPDVDSIRKHPR